MQLNFDTRFFNFLSEIESFPKTQRGAFKAISWLLRWKIVTIPLFAIECILAAILWRPPIPFIHLIVKSMTGFAGYYIRACYYCTRAKKWSGNIIIDEDVIFENIGEYEFDEFIQIDKRVIIGCESMSIGKGVHIAMGTIIGKGGRVVLKDFSGISYGCILIPCSEKISHRCGPMIPYKEREIVKGCIILEKNSIIFSGSIIFHNMVIGEGAIVSAGMVVSKHVKDWKIAFMDCVKDRKIIAETPNYEQIQSNRRDRK